jgi:CRP/FNR family transcriptional regulator
MQHPTDTHTPAQRLTQLLTGLAYFEHLDEPRLAQLAALAVQRRFEPASLIFAEGDASAGLWLLEAGHVKIYKLTPDGREHILHLLGPGDTFNDVAALDRGPNAANAAAIGPVVAWVIPTELLQSFLAMDQALALGVIQALARRIRQLVLQVEDLALRSVTARLARFILEQAENPALAGPAVTRALIATYLATTPETISRALRVLEQAGAIRFDRHRIVVVKDLLLREMALLTPDSTT